MVSPIRSEPPSLAIAYDNFTPIGSPLCVTVTLDYCGRGLVIESLKNQRTKYLPLDNYNYVPVMSVSNESL
jgi:hypothetical protein